MDELKKGLLLTMDELKKENINDEDLKVDEKKDQLKKNLKIIY